MAENKYTVSIKELDKSEVEIVGEISFEELNKNRGKAIKKISENINISGFRRGHIPNDVLVKNVGEMAILREMAEISLSVAYPEIVIENKVDAIGYPEITITKIAMGNPLGFKIKTAVMPSFELKNYKEVARKEMSKEEKIEVTEEEVTESIKQIRKRVAEQKMLNKNEAPKEIKDEDLPEMTDEFVKTLGDFTDVEDFKKKLKDNIFTEKENRLKEKKRISTIEEIMKDVKIKLPEILIENELDKMLAQFKDDLAKMGLIFDKYLEHIKKTTEDLKKEWRGDAEKRSKMQLILNKIVSEEHLKVNEEELEKNVIHILEHHKNAKEENVRSYIETVMLNEEVFKFLEKQK